jgi:hypothetical protein
MVFHLALAKDHDVVNGDHNSKIHEFTQDIVHDGFEGGWSIG